MIIFTVSLKLASGYIILEQMSSWGLHFTINAHFLVCETGRCTSDIRKLWIEYYVFMWSTNIQHNPKHRNINRVNIFRDSSFV